MDRNSSRGIPILCWMLVVGSLVVVSATKFAQAHDELGQPVPSPLPDYDPGPFDPGPDGEFIATGLSVSSYSSRPGAPYTLYLDFGGFNFSGGWGGGSAPGNTPAYTIDLDPSSFSSTELANIKNIWSRVAEKYAPFKVNVTTVDPAVAAGQSGTDLQRQNYYDSQPRMMHTVIGGTGAWSGGGGVSYIGVTSGAQSGSNGYHTNWVFSAHAPANLQFVAEASAHENGHGLNLYHQSDYSDSTLVNEYSTGTGGGVGSKAPIMGNSYSAARGLWREGTAHIFSGGPTMQNDAAKIVTNSFIMQPFVDDAVGHTLATATPLPLNGANVKFELAEGVIVPVGSNPSSSGASNYVSDYWSFSTLAGAVTFSVKAGRDSITPGSPDPGAMLDASLEILDSSGMPVATAATSTLSETLSLSLTAGDYYLHIMSAADPSDSGYFDMGSYFLTGTLVPVPEPFTLALALGGAFCAAIFQCRGARVRLRRAG